jgi:hypothetical protein
MPPFLDKRVLLSFNPLAGNRSGLRRETCGPHISVCSTFRLRSASLAQPVSRLLCPLLTSPRYFGANRSAPQLQSSEAPGRSPEVRHATVTAQAPDLQSAPQPQMEGFAVTCPLAPDAPRLISGSCSSPRSFGFSFLREPTSRGGPCRFPSLRLCENLAVGLSPT